MMPTPKWKLLLARAEDLSAEVDRLRSERDTALAKLAKAREALRMLDKWFTPSGSSVRARWDRIPPEERLAIVNAVRAVLSEIEEPHNG